jgi:hypothetical protein
VYEHHELYSIGKKARAKTANKDNPFLIYRAQDCATTDQVTAFLMKTSIFSVINRIPVMAPLFGVHFYGGVSPSKIGLIAPS